MSVHNLTQDRYDSIVAVFDTVYQSSSNKEVLECKKRFPSFEELSKLDILIVDSPTFNHNGRDYNCKTWINTENDCDFTNVKYLYSIGISRNVDPVTFESKDPLIKIRGVLND